MSIFSLLSITAQNMTIRNELSKVEALRRNITEQENIIDDLEMMIAMNEFCKCTIRSIITLIIDNISLM